MGRSKSKRVLRFKPKYREFAPVGHSNESLSLLHEELEALYLMDFCGMYQEEAAESMGVSRSTLSRILKSAHFKTAVALTQGKSILIEDQKSQTTLAYCTNNSSGYGKLGIREKHIVITTIHENKIESMKILPNPLYENDIKPTQVLPEILIQNGVNYFIAPSLGVGLRSTLLNRGIFTIAKESIAQNQLYKIIEA